MSELLDRLKAKYPRYKVISEPDPECGCKGTGEKHVRPSEFWPNGRDAPCLCICLSGDGRAAVTRAFGNAAKKVADEFKAELQSDAAVPQKGLEPWSQT